MFYKASTGFNSLNGTKLIEGVDIKNDLIHLSVDASS